MVVRHNQISPRDLTYESHETRSYIYGKDFII
jgi:hypothetical protein